MLKIQNNRVGIFFDSAIFFTFLLFLSLMTSYLNKRQRFWQKSNWKGTQRRDLKLEVEVIGQKIAIRSAFIKNKNRSLLVNC
jgi:hypothetical protein